jgi:hypothetical protein
MANIPQKVSERLVAGIKKFQPILTLAQSHDANESDTVIIITDMLSEIFGYDKYSEITSEKADEARKRITRAANRAMRGKAEKNPSEESNSVQTPPSEISSPSATPISVSPPAN